MNKYKPIIILTLLLCLLVWPQYAQAGYSLRDIKLIPDECRAGLGKDCDLDSLLQMFVNFAQLLMAALTVFTLLLFVWSSFGLAASMGNPEKIQAAKAGMTGAIFGMVIVMTAWALINTFVCLMISSPEDPSCEIFGKPWWGYGEGVGDCREQAPYRTGDCRNQNLRLYCSDGPLDSFGTEVRALQFRLAALHCDIDTVDGCFGPNTELSVMIFQTTNGLQVDGIVGPETEGVLNSSLARDCDLFDIGEISIGGPDDKCCVPYDFTISCYSALACPTNANQNSEPCEELTQCQEGCCVHQNYDNDCQWMRQPGCNSTSYVWREQSNCPSNCGTITPTGCCFDPADPFDCFYTRVEDCSLPMVHTSFGNCPAECPTRP